MHINDGKIVFFKADTKISRNGIYSKARPGDAMKVVKVFPTFSQCEYRSLRLNIDNIWIKLCTTEKNPAYDCF